MTQGVLAALVITGEPALFGVGALVGGVIAIRIRPRRPLVVHIVALALFAAPTALLAAEVPAAVVALGTFLAGIGLMLGDVVWDSTLQRNVPPETLSRVSSYDWFGSLALYPLGLVIWGPISDAIGVDPALWLAAGLLLAVVVAPLAVREVRTMPGD